MKKKVTLLIMAMVLLIGGGTAFWLSGGQKEPQLVNPQTDTEIIQKWFPNIEGVDHVLWEVQNLTSHTSRVPGPSGFWAKGFIYLNKEMAEQYKNQFEWEISDIKPECETIDTSAFEGVTWYYSKTFEDEMKPASYLGNFYFNGAVIWFDVTK